MNVGGRARLRSLESSYNRFTGWFENFYWYNSVATAYFDQKQPNPATEHGAPASDFGDEDMIGTDVVVSSPEGENPQAPDIPPEDLNPGTSYPAPEDSDPGIDYPAPEDSGA